MCVGSASAAEGCARIPNQLTPPSQSEPTVPIMAVSKRIAKVRSRERLCGTGCLVNRTTGCVAYAVASTHLVHADVACVSVCVGGCMRNAINVRSFLTRLMLHVFTTSGDKAADDRSG